jgi:hypothetical protein
LSLGRPNRRMVGVTARRSYFALLGALLAFVAMLGISSLSVWHSTMLNDADPIHAVSVGHIDSATSNPDPDGPLHVAAHATGQFLSIDTQSATTVLTTRAERIWIPFTSLFRDDSAQSSLLRPPRA